MSSETFTVNKVEKMSNVAWTASLCFSYLIPNLFGIQFEVATLLLGKFFPLSNYSW